MWKPIVWENKENVISSSSDELAQRVVKINTLHAG